MTDQQLIEMQAKSTATFSAKVLADSVNPCGDRLTTFELTYPLVIHAQMCRHRISSRNSASGRAIPTIRLVEAVLHNPYIPFHIGAAQSGMQAYEEVSEEIKEDWLNEYRSNMLRVVKSVQKQSLMGVCKQNVNRQLAPYLFTTEIVSATSLNHFVRQRDHHAAEPNIQHLAKLMVSARSQSLPEALKPGEWHLPLVYNEDRSRLNMSDLKKVSVARCARVSYVRQNADTSYEEDFQLYDRLVGSDPKHASPTEHQATPHGYFVEEEVERGGSWVETDMFVSRPSANFKGWKQHRQEIVGEFVPDEPYTGKTLPYCGREELA